MTRHEPTIRRQEKMPMYWSRDAFLAGKHVMIGLIAGILGGVIYAAIPDRPVIFLLAKIVITIPFASEAGYHLAKCVYHIFTWAGEAAHYHRKDIAKKVFGR